MNSSTTPSPSSSLGPLQFLDPNEFLYSFYLCMGGFAIVVFRAIVWGTRYCKYHQVNARAYLSQKKDPPSYAPLLLSFLLMVVLALRAAWSYVKYDALTELAEISVSPQLLALLDHLPLLILLSAFSKISLFWVRSFGMEKTNHVSWIVFTFNLLLYLSSFGQIILSFWYTELLNPHSIYYIVELCAIALWCLILSTLFSVYGWRLRYRLAQSIDSSQQVRDTFNRILAATICCTALFLMRGILFCVLIIRFNVFNSLNPKLNHIVYPLLVYTVPDVVSSICILFIMDVKPDERVVASSSLTSHRHHHYRPFHARNNNSAGYDSLDSRQQNYGGVGSIIDHGVYGSAIHRRDDSNYLGLTISPGEFAGEGETAFLDEQSPTDSLNKDWHNNTPL